MFIDVCWMLMNHSCNINVWTNEVKWANCTKSFHLSDSYAGAPRTLNALGELKEQQPWLEGADLRHETPSAAYTTKGKMWRVASTSTVGTFLNFSQDGRGKERMYRRPWLTGWTLGRGALVPTVVKVMVKWRNVCVSHNLSAHKCGVLSTAWVVWEDFEHTRAWTSATSCCGCPARQQKQNTYKLFGTILTGKPET